MRCKLTVLTPASRTLKKLLEELEFECNNKHNGCLKKIKYERMAKHLAECDFAEVQCSGFKDCKTKGLRPVLRNHMLTCGEV